MSSELQLDARHLNRWRRHLVNVYEERQAWCSMQVKLCDPCVRDLKRFIYHARRYPSALLYLFTYTAIIRRRPISKTWSLQAEFVTAMYRSTVLSFYVSQNVLALPSELFAVFTFHHWLTSPLTDICNYMYTYTALKKYQNINTTAVNEQHGL